MASGQSSGTGGVKEVTDNQTKVLLVSLAPYIAAALIAVTAWLQSVGTSHEVTLKEAIALAAKEIIASQQKQTEVIKADVKPAVVTPVVAAPPATPTKVNPLVGLSREDVKKLTDEYFESLKK